MYYRATLTLASSLREVQSTVLHPLHSVVDVG